MGKEANKSGIRLENWVETLIKDNHYHFVPANRYKASKELDQKIYSKQIVIGKTIYDTNRKCDFITYNPYTTKTEIVIECKWQDVGGSVDEKYPFLVLNIKKIGINTIIILDGDGYKKKAKEWLKEQVNGCLLEVMSLTEFAKYVKKKIYFR